MLGITQKEKKSDVSEQIKVRNITEVIKQQKGSPCGIMGKVLDCNFKVSEFEL